MARQDILFLHHGFPGQFYHWAAALAALGHRVIFLSSKTGGAIPGAQCLTYEMQSVETGGHPLLEQTGQYAEAGCAVWRSLKRLRESGFQPQTVISHADFGVGLFVKQVYPFCRMIVYCEWYFHWQNNEWDFEPMDAARLRPGHRMTLQLSNASLLLTLQQADVLLTPSEWQRSRFPKEYRKKMLVIPDGIDTELYRPPSKRQNEIPLVTYVSRTMEPFRGFEKFTEALWILMQRNKDCKALMIGQTNRHEYSSPPPEGHTYKDILLERFPLEGTRVRFTGWLSEIDLLKALQASTVHVYLTRPYVLSWSFLQSLSAGCAVIASNTAPVLEEVQKVGDLPIVEPVDYFSPIELADAMEQLMSDADQRAKLGQNARRYIEEHHSLHKWLPEHCRLVEEI